MLPTIINFFPITLTFLTGFGVMIHDTKLDSAAVTAISSHTSSAHATGSPLNTGNDMPRPSDPHTHAESVRVHHLGSQEPRLNTRDTDIRKFVVGNKKLPLDASAV